MDSQTLYGLKACLAMLEKRPEDLIRLYHGRNMRGKLRGMLSWAAARHIPYRELDAEGLQKVARSQHHEGIVLVCKPLRYRALSPETAGEALRRRALWVALDGVANPFNQGAIVRSCAFFGAEALLVGGAEPEGKVNGAVPRVAEGGAESVALYAAPGLAEHLRTLHESGFRVIGLETGGGQTLERAAADGLLDSALVLVLGGESEGLSRSVHQACDAVCTLAGGGGDVSSLNVSVAAGVALAEAVRLRP